MRFGVIGLGRIALQSVIPALRKTTNAELYAVASRSLDRAKAAHPTRAYGSYEALINDPGIDAVYISTANGSHHWLTMAALRSGKNVLCEKPLAPTAAECQEMVAAAEAKGLRLMEAFMYRFHPQIELAGEILQRGEIGALRIVESSFHFNMRNSEDYRLNVRDGGGALLDVGCYCVNASRLFLGDEPQIITASSVLSQPHQVDLAINGVLSYSDQKQAVLACSFLGGLHQSLALIGTDGVMLMNEPFIEWTGERSLTVIQGRQKRRHTFEPTDTFQLEIDNFAASIQTGEQPFLSADEGLRNARILDQLRAASQV